ncbi:restriction endonuclease subunit S [Bacteroides xylanisolvens]|uniref:Restriction endonuclease subunit S n=1 Tax=Bacteroides xylanisolvens TaxID=371601 RepID=A0A7J5Q1R5_9BACE|nr:restriction endonuclease subunit S [Bacteroides xylanisolvens]KAB6149667.1 restriction endonuclease subunit S [Bacteroides xylanisolvens]MCA4566516.1 restriction endonuclease subunit S [Bacteroides xylanisolvens]MCA4638414.1 restriction endonuclease subunit S [Bacteroides xylanisolvens]MCA4643085.1 restriction endonuclease subunit S [Bacteroides xylanisolvens]MCA4647945.1 restriction endonuclease subunit S [Bacteroides xylanisolvens]
MEETKIYKFSELCSKIGSGATPKGGKESYLGGNIALIRSQNVLDFNFSVDGLAYINNEQAQKLNNVSIEENDVLLNITGDSVARACMAPSWILPARVNQHVAIIRGNADLVLNDYLLYFLQYKKSYLLSISQGGATRNALTKRMIEDIELLLPNLSHQRKVVSILRSLDSKIELNRRINDNLEQQAQALFKSWFVDFEPFKGEKFVESQLGMIPKGWKVGTLSDLLDIRYGKDHKKLNDGNIPVYGSGGIMRLADGILYNGESVLIPRKGTLNNVLYVNWPFWTVDTMFYSIEKVPNVAKYCHLLLSKLDLASMNSGSAVPSMTTDILNKIQVIVANQDVFSSFNECISSLYLKAKINLDENKRLSETRDLLLPKLMSGRLIIKDLHS